MGRGRSVIEFDGLAEEGRIVLPPAVAELLGEGIARLRVRLTRAEVGRDLLNIGVRDDEIDYIAGTQLESPDQVVTFLLSQGALRKHTHFRARIATYKQEVGRQSRRGRA